ncbi:MAG TPA: pilus assembly protein PilM [Coriobacteriia bacterium]|nr:pilus assembly protein PilM [Coriobacteriia bacterium]
MSKSRVIGLDLGTFAVRAAEIEFKGGSGDTGRPTLLQYGEVRLVPGAVQDGEVNQPETVATALKELWRANNFGTRDVVMGVGSRRVIVRDLELPFGPMAQLRASLPFQVQDLLPMPVEEALLDYFPTEVYESTTGLMVKGMLVAASKDTVRANVMAAESAGLRPQMVDLNAFALLRALAREELAQQVVAVVDIGARITTVVIAARGVPRFTRVLSAGGQDVTDAVAGNMEISSAEAEIRKREIGVGFATAPEWAMAPARGSTRRS